MITIGTRILEESVFPQLAAYAELFSRLERLLFVALYVDNELLTTAKSRFILEYKITARQFNAVHNQVEAKVESWRECHKLNLANTRDQIAKTEAVIRRTQSPFARHQKERKVTMLEHRVTRIEGLLAAAVPSICFGSRKVFRAQFNLEENGYTDHAAWLADWHAARASGFFVLGSADEKCGNQTCQHRDGKLHLRLPDALGGQIIEIPVKFTYREKDFMAALAPKVQEVTRGPRQGQSIVRGDAISYRFVRRGTKWYAQVSFAVAAAPITTDARCGAVGIDLNPWGMAVSRIDHSGNPAESFDLPWSVAGRTEEQVEAAVGDRVRDAVLYAKKHQVPIAIERLDFAEAKKEHRGEKLNKMLSHFAYSAFAQMVQGRCAREGVELFQINPAFTSVIGGVKFAAGYGLGVHRAAAVTIARRALNFGEKLCARHTRNAPALPVRKRQRHVWSDWSRHAKACRASTQRIAKKSRSQTPASAGPLRPIPSDPTGGAHHHTRSLGTPARVCSASGATPQANRHKHCSSGVNGPLPMAGLPPGHE